MNQQRLVSKRAKMVFDYAVKIKGSYNVQGSQKPMDSGDYICRIIGGGIDQWVFASNPIPDVMDADCLTFAGKLDKTKKGKPAVTLGSLVEISLDGETVWAAKPIDRLQDDDEPATPAEPSTVAVPASNGNGKRPVSQSTSAPVQTPGRAAAGV